MTVRPTLWQWCQLVGLDADEINSAGYLGVCQAAQTWEPKGGERFCWYALRYIDRRVRDACRATERYKARKRGGTSTEDLDDEALDALPAPVAEDRSEFHDELVKLQVATGNLPAKMWQVLVWRYGFAGKCHTLREVGDALGVSKDVAQHIERKALVRCQW